MFVWFCFFVCCLFLNHFGGVLVLKGKQERILTWMLGGNLGSALCAPPLFTLLLTSFLLVTVGLSSVTLPNLTLLPLDGFGTGVSSKLRLQLHHACPDRMTLPTGLIALWPLSPLCHDAVDGWGSRVGQRESQGCNWWDWSTLKMD